jgi:hypothetical protein
LYRYFAAKPANIIASRALWVRMLALLERGGAVYKSTALDP